MGDEVTADQKADAIAAVQFGAISHAQAQAAGLTLRQVSLRQASGRWRREGRGVSVVSAVAPSAEQRVAVAMLKGPPGTVASHLTALALHGVGGFPAAPQVTVPPSTSRRPKDTRRRRGVLPPHDLTVVRGLPATTAARSLVDAASLVGYDRLCDLVDTTLFLRLATADEVREVMRRTGPYGRTGLRRLEAALAVWTPGPHPGSQAEMRLMRRIQAWGFPLPERQMVVLDQDGRFVAKADAGYRERKVLLEYQGKEFHGPRREPFDDERRARVESLGYSVVWVVSEDLRLGAPRLRAALAALLECRT